MVTTARKVFQGGEFLVTEVSAGDVFAPEDFSGEQRQLAETTEQFAIREVLPNAEKLEHQEPALMGELFRKCGELGLLMIDVPAEYGGLELGKVESALAAEKISVYGGFSTAFNAHTGIGTLPLVYYGTGEQKRQYLPKIITGEWKAAYCLTEPGSGSDALGARTTARLSGDGTHYVLNGTKQFITNGGFADLLTVFAKVDNEKFTGFLVERTFDGVSVGPEEKKLGIKGSSTTQVILDDAKVPVANVLGQVGAGHKIAFNVLNLGRFKLGASVTGGAKFAFVEGVKYANLRKQFGVPIATFGAIREKIADQAADIFAAESVVYRLAGMIDDRLATVPKGTPGYYEACRKGIEEYAVECAVAKVFCSDALSRVVDEVVQIFGGYGFIQEYPAERFYRDERINRIFEGTNEINRILIPGVLLKRAMKGEIPLGKKAMEAVEAMTTPPPPGIDEGVPFAAERATLRNLKSVFLALAGAAVRKYMDRIKDEQEILQALADVAINVFAVESAVARAEKSARRPGNGRVDAVAAAVKVFTFNAVESAAAAARKAAFFIAEGDEAAMLLAGVRRFTNYDATGLLKAKRLLAQNILEAERYIF